MGEKTDSDELIRDLNAVLPLQCRCAIAFAVVAGTLPGPEGVALSETLHRIAAAELADVERLAARITSLGGSPQLEVGTLDAPTTFGPTLRRLVGLQRQTIQAVVEAIPADADDAEGEATEHLLEHVIERKRNALELLERALR